MKADGAICVKTAFERGFAEDRNLPVPKLETIRALVKTAHAAGMPVLMHANSDEAQRFGLDAGVDILAHGLWNWSLEHSTGSDLTPSIKKLLDDELTQNIGWQPTMQVLYGLSDLFNPSFLSDPRLLRVLPSNLIDWYRSRRGPMVPRGDLTGREVARQRGLKSARRCPQRGIWPGHRSQQACDGVPGRTARPALVRQRYAECPHLRQSTRTQRLAGNASASRCGRNSGADFQFRDADERACAEVGSGTSGPCRSENAPICCCCGRIRHRRSMPMPAS